MRLWARKKAAATFVTDLRTQCRPETGPSLRPVSSPSSPTRPSPCPSAVPTIRAKGSNAVSRDLAPRLSCRYSVQQVGTALGNSGLNRLRLNPKPKFLPRLTFLFPSPRGSVAPGARCRGTHCLLCNGSTCNGRKQRVRGRGHVLQALKRTFGRESIFGSGLT